MDTDDKTFWRASRNVTLIGAVLDAALGVLKIFVGTFAHSYSLIADGIHSLSDLATDFIVLVITRFSRSSPDSDHPYGHARFETLATVLLGFLLFAVAVALAWDNLQRFLRNEELPIPAWPALVVAALSIGSKEWIYRYTARVAKQYKSDLLLANAWHSRSDALSSIVVLIGVAGAMMGIVWMDLVAALVVAAIIAKIAITFIWNNLRQLVDEGIPVPDQKKILALAREVEGVLDVHDLRSRLMGSEVFLEIHIQVNPWISVSEGHYIGNRVSKNIRKHMPDVADIVFHIDIEDKHEANLSHLPTRSEVLQTLSASLPGFAESADLAKTKLHYIKKQIAVEVFLPDCNDATAAKFRKQTASLLEQNSWLASIHFWG